MDICACNVIKCVSIQGLFVTIDDLQAFTVVYDEPMEQDNWVRNVHNANIDGSFTPRH